MVLRSMIPVAFLMPLFEKYALKVGIGLVAAIVAIGFYFYWHGKVYDKGYDAAVVKYEKRDTDTARQSAELLKLKQHEADIKNKENTERLINATKIYAERYANISANPVIERVLVRAEAANCSSYTMPGSGEDRSTITARSARAFAAELPAENTRELDKTIRLIEETQAKCEYLLNQLE